MSLHYSMSPNSSAIYADWISEYPWEMALHLTTRFPLSEFKLKEVLEKSFHRRLTRVAQRSVEGYFVMERHRSGQLHVHVLLLGVQHLHEDVVCSQWREGSAVVKRIYDLSGAVRYAVKEIDAVPDGRGFLGTRAERYRLVKEEPLTPAATRAPDAKLLDPNELPF